MKLLHGTTRCHTSASSYTVIWIVGTDRTYQISAFTNCLHVSIDLSMFFISLLSSRCVQIHDLQQLELKITESPNQNVRDSDCENYIVRCPRQC